MTKTALISGIIGQDGSFLTELFLEKRYDVYGIIRRFASFNTERTDPSARRVSNARNTLGWQPNVRFDEFVKLSTDHDLELARHEAATQKLGPMRAVKKYVGAKSAISDL